MGYMDTITQERDATEAPPSAEENTAPEPEVTAKPPYLGKIADVVREIKKTTDLAEPRAIAKEVINRVEEFTDEQLVEIIAAFVVSLDRPALSVVKNLNKDAADIDITDREPSNRRPPQPSSRVAAVSNWWQSRLDERYVCKGGARKALRDMTMDDVIANRDKVQALADRLKTRATGWEELAAAMVKYKVTKAGELTVDQVPQAVAAITPH